VLDITSEACSVLCDANVDPKLLVALERECGQGGRLGQEPHPRCYQLEERTRCGSHKVCEGDLLVVDSVAFADVRYELVVDMAEQSIGRHGSCWARGLRIKRLLCQSKGSCLEAQ
jgi:hypothetical protein